LVDPDADDPYGVTGDLEVDLLGAAQPVDPGGVLRRPAAAADDVPRAVVLHSRERCDAHAAVLLRHVDEHEAVSERGLLDDASVGAEGVDDLLVEVHGCATPSTEPRFQASSPWTRPCRPPAPLRGRAVASPSEPGSRRCIPAVVVASARWGGAGAVHSWRGGHVCTPAGSERGRSYRGLRPPDPHPAKRVLVGVVRDGDDLTAVIQSLQQ